MSLFRVDSSSSLKSFTLLSESNEQVFGQTLYKCILNDLQQSANRLSKSIKSAKPSSNTSSAQNILNQKWKLKNHNNLLIASKFDLNLLNSLDIINLNNNPPAETPTTVACPTETSISDSLFSKRNSVLFEALDLKNVDRLNSKLELNKKQQPSDQKPSEQSSLINSQNLSIRSEGLVPNIVKSCCKHISEHGLDVVGIFRIDSSKKRIKEIKEMYDTGKEVLLDESFNPNDAACVLKEYLRSLPEPLLTRDLYSGFLATTKLKDSSQRLEAVRHLICLLPVPNRDTLQVLLKLLDNVRNHSSPVLDENETQTGGNKMDAFNLAMVFGPNLLKKHKVSQTQSNNPNHLSDKYSLIDDIDSVISVTKYLIENQNSIFYIEAGLHNELIQTIDSVSPDEINAILTRKIVASIGVSVENNEMGSDSSGYDSSIKSNLAASTISTDNSDSGTLKRQFNDESSSATSTSCSYSNFIDTNPNLKRTSRTKLHKIANFGQTSSSNLQPISFLSSPTHSPTRATSKPSKRVSSNAHESSKENVYKNFSNELYNNLNGIEAQAASKPRFVSNNPASVSSSSLLLMINNNSNSQSKHLAKTGANKYSVNDENVYSTSNQVQQQIIKFNSKPAKSLLNLNSNDIVNSGEQAASDRRQSASGAHGQQQPQFKIINANTIQICSKFYDKSKFNIIGEQETLV